MTDPTTDLMDERMDERLSAAGRRWRGEQPEPPAVPLERLVAAPPRRVAWRAAAAAAAAVVVVGGGTILLLRTTGGGDAAAPSRQLSFAPASQGGDDAVVVPWRPLPAGHHQVGHRVHGRLVTPYDSISAGGHIDGIVRPEEELEFVVTLESPSRVSLHPCPDYTIAFGRVLVVRQLNCAQVPYFASVLRGHGQMSNFWPTIPAQTPVSFAMRVRVPDVHGPQKVLWTLDGPESSPGFYGVVRVVPGWAISGVPRSPRALVARTAGQPARARRPR
jgi:hypothetical protein